MTLMDCPQFPARVTEAASFENLIDLLTQQPFNLVIASAPLLQEEGDRALFNIQRTGNIAPILGLFDSGDMEELNFLQAEKISGIISKSAGSADFIKAIKVMLEGGIYLPQISDMYSNDLLPENIATKTLLTNRQIDVWQLVARGDSNKDIARKLDISEGTVKVHVTAILKTLGVKNRTQAMLLANNPQT